MISCSSSHGRAASFFVAPRVRYLSQALFGRGLALYVVCAAGVPHATWADPEPSLWYHNGSIVYLVAKGTLREFHYKEPRLGMLDEGVRPGALLFRGQSNTIDISAPHLSLTVDADRCRTKSGAPFLIIPSACY